MRSSTVLALLGASLAVAAPAHHALHKKAYVTDIVTDIVYVTVTAGDLPPPPPPTSTPSTSEAPKPTSQVHHSASQKATTTSIYTPPPPPPATPAPEPNQEPTPTPTPTPQAPAIEVAASTAAAAEPAPTDYKSTAIWRHDEHRRNHSAGALTWDDALASYAETIARGCVFAHDMTQGGGGYGQNLAAYGTSADISSIDLSTVVADAITNQWYNGEAANIPYGEDSPSLSGPEFLHATQLLWNDTTTVGCYTAQCGAGTIFSYHSLYTVCNYKKQGNVLGSFASEVFRPIGLAALTATIS